MAITEARPHSQLELQNSLKQKGEPPRARKMNRRTKVLASVALITALGVGGDEAGFSHQSSIAKSQSASEVVEQREELAQKLESRGLKGDPQKPLPIEVVTFNTASGNPRIKTPQSEFVQLPFYQKVIRGEPDAPIIGLQEAGPEQVKELSKLAEETNNFSYEYIRSNFSKGGNLLLVPKRFEVIKSKSEHYSWPKQVVGIFTAVKENGFDPSQIWPRMYTEMKLKDSLSGKEFTVFNTHLSYVEEIQDEQADQFFDAIAKEGKEKPVIVMGDLNDNNFLPYEVGRLTDKIVHAGLSDMGPERPPRRKTNIDYVLAKGFTPLKKSYLYDIRLPSSSTSEKVSDHYAEADVIQMEK